MKIIIAGSRDVEGLDFYIKNIIDRSMEWFIECLNPCRKVGEASPDTPIEIVSGGAEGVDTIAIEWAKANHLPVKVFPADWSKHGKSAGFIRNAEMAKYADALICIRWDYSKGSKNMAELMIKANKPVIQYILPKMPSNMLVLRV